MTSTHLLLFWLEDEGYPVPSPRRYCMDGHARWRDYEQMLPDLWDFELETAARACRALAYQEGEQAGRI